MTPKNKKALLNDSNEDLYADHTCCWSCGCGFWKTLWKKWKYRKYIGIVITDSDDDFSDSSTQKLNV